MNKPTAASRPARSSMPVDRLPIGAAITIAIPDGHVGPVVLPQTGRTVWWTGRVAIGLRHQPTRNFGPITQSAMWVQSLLLNGKGHQLSGV